MAAINAPRFGLVQFVSPGNNLTLYFRAREPAPDGIPPELEPYMSRDIYQARVRAVMNTASRYIKPTFEIIWFLVAIIAGIAAPIAAYYIISGKHRTNQDCSNANGDNNFDNCLNDYSRASLISFSVFLGINLLSILPIFLWKRQGRKTVNKMLQNFEKEDRAAREPGAVIPVWRVRLPYAMTKTIRVQIDLPPSTAPTYFQAGVAVPPYLVNPPQNPGNLYNYGQGVPVLQQPGGPRNEVPLYDDRDEKIPGYIGHEGQLQRSPVDMKNPFDDVPV